jgi:cytochrome c oxidase subunit II
MIRLQRKSVHRALRMAAALLSLFTVALLTALPVLAGPNTPPSALDPKGSNATTIAGLFNIVLIIAVVVFVIVEGLLLFSAWRFRHKPEEAVVPPQIHGNTRFELAWTIVPALIVVSLFVLTLQTQQKLDNKGSSEPITVKVIGHQWWWEYQYPDLNITTGTDLVIPTGRTVNLEITSIDVIHSFWVPQLNGKTDAIPNHINTSWIEADQPGTYFGQCAELCGASHANMRIAVIAKDDADFQAWVTAQQAGPAQPSTADATAGQQVFMTGPCVGCHSINGTAAVGKVGPNLTHFGSRTHIAGGMFENTAGNLTRWLSDPPGVKPGSIMPNLHLNPADIQKLVAYLESLQ